jgi:hypothetical protein
MNSLIKGLVSLLAAYRIILALNSVAILFHMLVLTGILPSDIVWAGRLKSQEELVVFETISIAINLLLIITAYQKMTGLKSGSNPRYTTILLWMFVVLFTLNTLGNLTALTSLETYVATPLTFILAVCCARLALETRG